MNTTTSYGTWVTATGGTEQMSPEDLVSAYLGEFADEYDADKIVRDLRREIDRALGSGITRGISLHGTELYGPYPYNEDAADEMRDKVGRVLALLPKIVDKYER